MASLVGGPTATANVTANGNSPSVSYDDAANNRKYTVYAILIAFLLSTITHGIGKWPA